jgi:hypothetical protein
LARRRSEDGTITSRTVSAIYSGAQDFFTADTFAKVANWTQRHKVASWTKTENVNSDLRIRFPIFRIHH